MVLPLRIRKRDREDKQTKDGRLYFWTGFGNGI